MNSEQYETNRNRLVDLIDRALALPKIPTKTAEEIRAIRRKVHENQFRIVLMSGFQCGKSTTFNRMCGGEEISPRGALTRTSATIISAHHTDDERLVGKASVVWRTDQELIQVFARQLYLTLKQLRPERFVGILQSAQLSTALNLAEKADRDLVSEAAAGLLSHAERLEESDREILRHTVQICRHYDAPAVLRLKARDEFTVEEVGRLVRFPENWDCAESGDEAEKFVFLFIKEAAVYIRSEQLRRTGSVLVDCPGFFASNYDTQVALDVLENADAVWYIFNGMGLNADERRTVKSLVAAKRDSIFWTVNLMNGTRDNVSGANGVVRTAYVRDLNALGAEVGADDFRVFHSLLAIVAVQAEKLMRGTLDAPSIRAILALGRKFDRKMESVEEVLEEWADIGLGSMNVSRQERKAFNLFAPDFSGVKRLDELSGFRTILNAIEDTVVRRKARSVLIDNGARKVVELLKQVESELQVAETLATENEDRMHAEFIEAERRLDEFALFCDDELEALRDERIDHDLAFDYWANVIASSSEEVARTAAARIVRTHFNDVKTNQCTEIINDTFAEVVLPKATAWAEGIRRGENRVFTAMIENQITRIIEHAKVKWDSVIEGQPILAGIPMPTPVLGTDVMPVDFIESVIEKAPGISGKVVSNAVTYGAVGALIGNFVFPGLGAVVGGALASLFGGLVGENEGTANRESAIHSSIIRQLREKSEECRPCCGQTMSPLIQKQSARIRALRLGVIKAFEDAFEETRAAVAARYANARRLFEVEQQQRQELAARNRRLRLEQIEPLRVQVQEFERESELACGCDG